MITILEANILYQGQKTEDEHILVSKTCNKNKLTWKVNKNIINPIYNINIFSENY